MSLHKKTKSIQDSKYIIYDDNSANYKCNILSINYKAPITLKENDVVISWNTPAAYIYSSLLNNTENKINLNTIEPNQLESVHKTFIVQEEINETEKILLTAIKTMCEIPGNENLKELLINTRNKTIVYLSSNNLFGNGNIDSKDVNTGKNLIGKCYMKYREELFYNQKSQDRQQKEKILKNVIFEAYLFYIFIRDYLLYKYDRNDENNIIDKFTNSEFELWKNDKKITINSNEPEYCKTLQNIDANIVYEMYLSNKLEPGLLASINTIKDDTINTEEIIKIVKKDWLGVYVNNITVRRNKEILDIYIQFILETYFEPKANKGVLINKDQIIKEIRENQSSVFNSEPDICKNKIPERIVVLFNKYNDVKHCIKYTEEHFEVFMLKITEIMEKYDRLLLDDMYIKNITELYEYSKLLNIRLVVENENDENVTAGETIYIYQTEIERDRYSTIPSTQWDRQSYLLSPVHNCNMIIDDLNYPNISSYYLVQMLKFINNKNEKPDNYYKVIKKGAEYKSIEELSILYDKNYNDVRKNKLAKAIVKILNIKFTGCELSCAALDALLNVKEKNIIWQSNNLILGKNYNGEGENLVGLYLESIKNSIIKTQMRACNNSKKISNSKTIANLLVKPETKNLFIKCAHKFNYQVSLFDKFLDIFEVDYENNEELYTKWCKKFIILLFYRCDILYLITNNKIELNKIPDVFISNVHKANIIKSNTDMIQWFWGYYLLVATNITDSDILSTYKTEFKKINLETYNSDKIKYVVNFALTIISVIYYIVNIYINVDKEYTEFRYDCIIKFIEYLVFGMSKSEFLTQDEINNIDNTLNIDDFFKECDEKIGANLTDTNKREFQILFELIMNPPQNIANIKTYGPVMYFNNPKFMFDRNSKNPINI